LPGKNSNTMLSFHCATWRRGLTLLGERALDGSGGGAGSRPGAGGAHGWQVNPGNDGVADGADTFDGHLDDIARWTMAYHRLGAVARDRTWVAAHGEPHQANQLRTDDGRFLIDWDTLRLAPAEVDLRVLVEAGAIPDQVGADPAMIDLFDLEWRLDEISQYAAWFSAPHRGTRDDEIAFAGLREELARP